MRRIGRIAFLLAITASLLASALPASASSTSKMSSSEVAARAQAIASAALNASSPAEAQKLWQERMDNLILACGCNPPCPSDRKFGSGPVDPNGVHWWYTELDLFGSGYYPACSFAYTSIANTDHASIPMSANMNLRWWICGTAQTPAYAQRRNEYNPSVAVPSTRYGNCGPQADNYGTTLYLSGGWSTYIVTTSSLYVRY